MILSYISLFLAVVCTALGQFFYKKFSFTKDKKYYIFTIVLFLLTPVFSFLALQKLSIDIVYISTSLTIFLVILLSKLFLKEIITLNTYFGVLLILIGVIIYGS